MRWIVRIFRARPAANKADDSLKNLVIAKAALRARQQDLRERIGERDANFTATLHDMLPKQDGT